jgi:divalent metal cation (Fe/Co/Zn/Cd) transporter
VALRLEAATAAWMLVEGVLAIGAGYAARSVALTAFGFDSVIELMSALVLLWRFGAEARGASLERVERVERRATWISAALLALLCLYVLITAIGGLVLRLGAEGSPLGLLVAAVAVVAMPLLAARKRKVNMTIGSAALRADIAETVTCAYLAGTTLVGVVLTTLFGLWWADPVAALVLLFWLGRETVEAIAAAGRGA